MASIPAAGDAAPSERMMKSENARKMPATSAVIRVAPEKTISSIAWVIARVSLIRISGRGAAEGFGPSEPAFDPLRIGQLHRTELKNPTRPDTAKSKHLIAQD